MRQPGRFILLAAALLGVAGGVALLVRAGAARAAPEADPKKREFLGAKQCKTCHASRPADHLDSLDFVLLTEYTTWRALDKHAQAYAVLAGPRGRHMGKLLGNDEKFVLEKQAGCLGCHAMNYADLPRGPDFRIEDGVNCEGCHGPSKGWQTEHYGNKLDWRKKSGPEKERDFGLKDLRDPVRRAEVCTSCHVGSAAEGKVITHAMYAAGHPTLPPFELETFSKNLPQHWRDAKDVPFFKYLKAVRDGADPDTMPVGRDGFRTIIKQYKNDGIIKDVLKKYGADATDYGQTRVALLGSVVALRESAGLLAARAAPTGGEKPSVLWPELTLPGPGRPTTAEAIWPEIATAHAECSACHHELRPKGWRQQRGYGLVLEAGRIPVTPGRPPLRGWSFAAGEVGLRRAATAERTAGAISAEFLSQVEPLVRGFTDRPFGTPGGVRQWSAELACWCGCQLPPVAEVRLNGVAARNLLAELCRLRAAENADYETARQLVSLLTVVYFEWDPKGDKPAAKELLRKLGNELNLHPYVSREERVGLLRTELLKKDDQLPETEELLYLLERTAARTHDEPDKELTPAEGKKLEKFLDAVTKTTDQEFIKLLDTPAAEKALRTAGDAEVRRALRLAGDYDPQNLAKALAELRKILDLQPDKPGRAPAGGSR
jgi:hypothetical protein